MVDARGIIRKGKVPMDGVGVGQVQEAGVGKGSGRSDNLEAGRRSEAQKRDKRISRCQEKVSLNQAKGLSMAGEMEGAGSDKAKPRNRAHRATRQVQAKGHLGSRKREANKGIRPTSSA